MLSFVVFRPDVFRRSSKARLTSRAFSGTAASRGWLSHAHRQTAPGHRGRRGVLSDRRIGRQMQSAMSFEAHADEPNVVVRVERDFELIRNQQGNQPDRFFFHPRKSSRRLTITAARRKVAQTGCNKRTFPSGRSSLLPCGLNDLTESFSVVCLHRGLLSFRPQHLIQAGAH